MSVPITIGPTIAALQIALTLGQRDTGSRGSESSRAICLRPARRVPSRSCAWGRRGESFGHSLTPRRSDDILIC